jgi:hypothetical protein
MRRIVVILTVAALLVVALTVTAGTGFARQATNFEKGQTTTHQGNSTNSPVVSCTQGKGSSNPC